MSLLFLESIIIESCKTFDVLLVESLKYYSFVCVHFLFIYVLESLRSIFFKHTNIGKKLLSVEKKSISFDDLEYYA